MYGSYAEEEKNYTMTLMIFEKKKKLLHNKHVNISADWTS